MGNKCDLSNEKQVTEEDKQAMKKQTGIDIIEASAKNSFKINEAMEMITRKLMENSGRSNKGPEDNTTEKGGISLGDTSNQNNSDQGCCSSFI